MLPFHALVVDDNETNCRLLSAEDRDAPERVRLREAIAALYDGSERVSTETEVTYEDGRKGSIRATLEIRDAKTVPVEPKTLEEVVEAAE